MRYKYIFFDMDGTVGDTQEGIFNSAAEALEKLGIEFDSSYESMRRLIGPPLVYGFKEFFGADEQQAHKAKELYRERYAVKGIYEMELYKGIEKTLERLKNSGAYLAVVSAKPQKYIDIIIPHFGLDKYFDYSVGVSMTEKGTSKVHLIEKALCHFGISDYSEAVMVGDRNYDLDSAAELGIDGIGVSYGFGDREELAGCKPVYIADTAEEISEFILGD